MQILLVDDHAMFRAGLRALVGLNYPEAMVAEAGNGADAISRADEVKPDLILMDLHLPDQNGIEVSRQILDRLPLSKIIIVSADPGRWFVDQALMAGVSGYLLKTCAPGELSLAMNAVLDGKLYLCPELGAYVLDHYRQILTDSNISAKPALSAREREVLRLIGEGWRMRDIAGRLGVGVRTVETYRLRSMKKTACASTAELVRYAMREELLHA